jgi:hypothetical protein
MRFVVGCCLAAGIFLATFLVGKVGSLATAGLDDVVIKQGITWFERVLFAVDAFLLLWYVVYSALTLAKSWRKYK